MQRRKGAFGHTPLTASKGRSRECAREWQARAPRPRSEGPRRRSAPPGRSRSPRSRAPSCPPSPRKPQRALDPITIRVGANEGFTRVEFAGVVGSRSRVRRDGQTVIVRIGSTAAPDVARLKVDPPPGVEKVETRAALDATELVITLAEGADARTGSADGAVWLNLYPAGQVPAAPQGPAVPAGGAVPVVATKTADRVSMAFSWGAPVGAAVFRRGDAVWVVFDTAARMDMSKAHDLGPAGEARWAVGPDYTAVRISAPEGLPVSAVGEGATWTVTIGGQPTASQSVEVDRDDTGDTDLGRAYGRGDQDRLADRSDGRRPVRRRHRPGARQGRSPTSAATIDLTLLPTAQGLAIETSTDNLSIKAEGDLVTLSRPGGLTLSPPSMALEAAQRRRRPCAAEGRVPGPDPHRMGRYGRGRASPAAIASFRTRRPRNPSPPPTIRAPRSRRAWP